VNKKITKKLKRRKQRIQYRLRNINWKEQNKPMFSAGNIHYEIADRTHGLAYGGIGGMQLLARQTGLVKAIDDKLKLLKRHLPYYESDHVLNIAYNILCNGDCLEDIERLRNDEVYLDALGARRIPDPTTAGDFCRRFSQADVETLMDIINGIRLRVWRTQPDEFFEEAVIDVEFSYRLLQITVFLLKTANLFTGGITEYSLGRSIKFRLGQYGGNQKTSI